MDFNRRNRTLHQRSISPDDHYLKICFHPEFLFSDVRRMGATEKRTGSFIYFRHRVHYRSSCPENSSSFQAIVQTAIESQGWALSSSDA